MTNPITYPPDFEAWWKEHEASQDYVPTDGDKLNALIGWLARERLYLEAQ